MKTTKLNASAFAFAVLAAAVGCAPSAPDKPTWVDDVQPVMMANCVRCHGSPASGGAPSTFRLDLYEDSIENGQQIRGAASMARFVCVRGSLAEDMPPNGTAIPARARDMFANWFETRCTGPIVSFERRARARNSAPTTTINTGTGKADDSKSAPPGSEQVALRPPAPISETSPQGPAPGAAESQRPRGPG